MLVRSLRSLLVFGALPAVAVGLWCAPSSLLVGLLHLLLVLGLENKSLR